MMKRIMTMVLAAMFCVGGAQAGIIEQVLFPQPRITPKTIKVLVVHDVPGAVVEVKGNYRVYDPNTKKFFSKRFMGKKKYVTAMKEGIKWGEEFPGIYQLLIVPNKYATTTVVDGVEYRGSLYVYDIGGTISIVNEVDIEDYISSILAQQFKAPLPVETLASIAIAARTEALYQAESKKDFFWAVDARKVGYAGVSVIHPSGPIEKAIRSTHHMVMSMGNAPDNSIAPFPAQWSPDVPGAIVSRISLKEAEGLAQKGAHAAEILSQAFPGISVELVSPN